MKLMHVDSSPKRERSSSRALAQYFIEILQKEKLDFAIDYLDVAVETPPHVTEEFAIAIYKPAAERTEAMRQTIAESDKLCQRLLDADMLVFSMPMYNFSIPSNFKAFIDNIVRGELTYIKTADGQYLGQLAGKKVLFITTRGADLRPGSPLEGFDALTPSLKAAFGFIGVSDPIFVDAQPMQFAEPEQRAAALERAQTALATIASKWAGN
jgi:FMN-dependent NADH-azoreductase